MFFFFFFRSRWQRLAPNSRFPMKGRLYAHRFDNLREVTVSEISFRFTCSAYVNWCVTEEVWKHAFSTNCWSGGKKLLQVSPADELWYKTSRFEEVPGKKNILDQVHLPPVVSLGTAGRKMDSLPFFSSFFFKSLGCCSMDNVFFLLGLFISKQKQLTLGNFNGVALVHRSVDYDDDSFFFFYELRWYFCVNSWSIILYPFSLPPSRICSDMRISNSYLIIWVLIQREVVSVRHGYVRHLAQSQIWRSDQMHKK